MAEKRKQHFVPQFYMRNFSGDAEKMHFSLYHFGSSKRMDGVPIKDQNYDDYFYGKDGTIENALSMLEGAASAVVARVLANTALPERMSEDFITLVTFALFQSGRTPVAAAEIDEQLERFVKEVAKDAPELKDSVDAVRVRFTNAPAVLLRFVAESYVFVLDLKWKLLQNKTSRLYITSDHPAILYNQFLEKRKTFGSSIGLASKGLQFFLPLGPRHLLMMYDGGVYRVGGRTHLEPCIEAQEHDVAALNALQAANADELLFFSPHTAADHVAEAVELGRKQHLVEKASVKRYEGADEEVGDLIHLWRAELRVGLVLPSVVILPSAAGPQLSNHVVHLRDPEFVQICKDFRSQVHTGRYSSSVSFRQA